MKPNDVTRKILGSAIEARRELVQGEGDSVLQASGLNSGVCCFAQSFGGYRGTLKEA
jgi:hypothetical protein